MRPIWLMLVLCPSLVLASHPKQCVTADEAARLLDKDVCVSAHVYDVVELQDGTRFLDICPPGTPDDKCRLTIMSLKDDRSEVGELRKYRDMDVHIRGIVQPMHGRSGIILSHARQFHNEPPKFRPNPKLLHGFDGEASRPPISDPNLRPQGGHRGSMNSRDQVSTPRN